MNINLVKQYLSDLDIITSDLEKKNFLVLSDMISPCSLSNGYPILSKKLNLEIFENSNIEMQIAKHIYKNFEWVSFYKIENNSIRFSAGNFIDIGLNFCL